MFKKSVPEQCYVRAAFAANNIISYLLLVISLPELTDCHKKKLVATLLSKCVQIPPLIVGVHADKIHSVSGETDERFSPSGPAGIMSQSVRLEQIRFSGEVKSLGSQCVR